MVEILKIEGTGGICNTYIIRDDKFSVIVDPGGDYNLIKQRIGNTQPKAILATHGHYDHIVHVAQLKKEYAIPFYIHTGDAKLVKHANLYVKVFKGDRPIEIPAIDIRIDEEGDLFFESLVIKVLHTPGHTEGSTCFLVGDNLLTGDLLFKNKIGRTDFPGGSLEKLKLSLKKIDSLAPDALILPGHRANSSLEEERNNNSAYIEIINN